MHFTPDPCSFLLLSVLLFRYVHELKAHDDLTDRPSAFDAVRTPAEVVRHTAVFLGVHIKGSRPCSVKTRKGAVHLCGCHKGCRAAPEIVEHLVAGYVIGIGKAEGQPVVGVKKIGNRIAVVGKACALTAVVTGAAGLLACIPLGIAARGMAELLKILCSTVEPLTVLVLSAHAVKHGKGENETAVFLGLARLSDGVGIERHDGRKTVCSIGAVFLVACDVVRQKKCGMIECIEMCARLTCALTCNALDMLGRHFVHLSA